MLSTLCIYTTYLDTILLLWMVFALIHWIVALVYNYGDLYHNSTAFGVASFRKESGRGEEASGRLVASCETPNGLNGTNTQSNHIPVSMVQQLPPTATT